MCGAHTHTSEIFNEMTIFLNKDVIGGKTVYMSFPFL